MVKKKIRKNGKSRFFYRGVFYASKLEVIVAEILDKNKIPFEPHVMFEVNRINGNGKIKTREVDFVLLEEVEPYWSPGPIKYIEVKGRFNLGDWERKKELEAAGIFTFIATPAIIYSWDREGFIEYRIGEMQPAGRFRQDNKKRDNNEGEK